MLEQRSRYLAPILLVLSAWFSGLACNSNAPQSAAVGNTASAENQTGVRRGAVVRWAEGPSLSPPLGLMANAAVEAGEGEPEAPLRRPIGGNTFPNFVEKNPDYGSQHLTPNMPPILVRFAGLGFGFPGFSPSGTPPDTNGDVGPNHYVHIVNSSFVVLDRTDGHVLAGPMRINVPFQGFSGANGACATTNQGDPLIIYDRHADRWIISQLTPVHFASGPNYECVAISRTGDPTLSSQWYRYVFGPYTVQNGINALNDYPKTGVWPDAYYTTYNMFTAQSAGFRGAKFVVWERAAMVAGFPAREIEFQTFSDPRGMDGYGGALPSDWDGRFFPPANAPNLIISDDNTPAGQHGMGPVLQIWKIHVDWINPEQSTITDIPENCPPAILNGPCPILVNVNNFKLPCDDTAGNCVPQVDTTNRLDTLGDRLMYRLPYRNFPADHESILVSRSVDPGTNAPVAVRWYELQNPIGQTFADGQRLVQQGTHMPNDGKYRWMMSMAQDHVGNMAVGMSQSSPNIHPEIWIAGRKFDDPPNTLPQDEVQMTQGTSSDNTPTRWGDYSMLVLDPVDDCTFWYTTEYMAAPQTSGFEYRTDVGNFKFDTCQANEDNYGFEMPDSVEVNTATTFNITKRHSDGTIDDGYNGTADLRSTDPRVQGLPDNVTFTAGRVDNVPATFQTTGFRTVIATDHSALTIQGWGNTIITGGPATSIAVLNPFPALLRSGSQGSVTFVAHDSLGNIASGYNATVDVTYSDPDHTGPATLTFVNGIGELLNVTLITTGMQTITIRDPARPELTAVANTTVDPYKYFFSNVPPTPTAGQPFSFHLQAMDRMRRPATTYTNRDVRMSAASDPRATFPPTVTFTNGEADVSPATLFLAGGRTPITATDTRNAAVTSNTNAQADIGQANVSPSVQPATTTTFILRVGPTVDFPTAITNGSPVTVVCSARDAYNNLANFNGNVRFTSDDPGAELPPETTLVNGQRGGLMFRFHTDNVRRVTTTSVDEPTLHGTTAGTYVHPDHFAFDAIAGQTCASTTVHASARLANGNLDTTYDHLGTTPSSTDTAATFNPATVTFTGGQATFGVTFSQVGQPTVRLRDNILPSLSTVSSAANITLALTSSLLFNGTPSTAQIGTPVTFGLAAKNACGNPTTEATVHFTSDDPQASLPSDTSFAGSGGTISNLPVTFNTAGNHNIVATKVGGGATATSSVISVTGSTQQPPQPQTANTGCSATAGGSAGPFALMGLILAGWQLAQGMRASRRRG